MLLMMGVLIFVELRKEEPTNTTTNSGNTNQSYVDNSIHQATQDNEYTMYSAIATSVGGIVGGLMKFV